MSIPVQNIYYLLCYAWDKLPSRDLVDVSAVPNNTVENLFAKILVDGVSNLVRRGLDRGYRSFEEEGRRIRGKLLVSSSLKRGLFRQGKAACGVDEFTHDVPHNRILKAAMGELARPENVDRDLCRQLVVLFRMFQQVGEVPLHASAFRAVQLHRNNRHYGFLLNVCELLARCLLPDPKTGDKRFRPFTASDSEMGRLFEAFVRNFLRREQSDYAVSVRKVPWEVTFDSAEAMGWLPEMRTDVFLASPFHRIVIETKFYKKPFAEHFGARKLRSGHLYQLLAYLENLRGGRTPADGLLLYAAAEEALPPLEYRFGAHRLLVRSLDLYQDWQGIHRDLLGCIRVMQPVVGLVG